MLLDHSPSQPQDHKGEQLIQDQSVPSIPTEPVCSPLWVQNAISYMRYSTLYYRTGFVLGDSAQLEAMGVLWAGLRWARLSNGFSRLSVLNVSLTYDIFNLWWVYQDVTSVSQGRAGFGASEKWDSRYHPETSCTGSLRRAARISQCYCSRSLHCLHI